MINLKIKGYYIKNNIYIYIYIYKLINGLYYFCFVINK